MRRLIIALLIASVAVVAGAGLATPSRASAAALQSASGSTGALLQSSNWSGVVATSGGYHRVFGAWNVPAVSVSSDPRYAVTWAGIGGFSGGDLIQAGTFEESVNGTAYYWAFTELLPAGAKQVSLAVRPGDLIVVDINETSTNSWTISIQNRTTGQSSNSNVQYASRNASAEWIHEAPTVYGSQSRLATTGTVFFYGNVNGSTVIGSAGSLKYIQLSGKTKATPSKLDSDSDGFAVADGSARPAPPGS